jgi:hypothetical protein
MDMQIAGKLSKDVSILASISDHNLPIQADGYTQTLQEFDKIYLQLNIKDKSILKAGHLDLQDNKPILEIPTQKHGNWFSDQFWERQQNFSRFFGGSCPK